MESRMPPKLSGRAYLVRFSPISPVLCFAQASGKIRASLLIFEVTFTVHRRRYLHGRLPCGDFTSPSAHRGNPSPRIKSSIWFDERIHHGCCALQEGEQSNEDELVERLNQFVEDSDFSFHEIASRIGTAAGLLSMWLARTARPHTEELAAIEKFLQT
jgi:hypothetical protein